MNKEQLELFNHALRDYGARLTEDGLFHKHNRDILAVRVRVHKGRVRFENATTSALIMSGPVSAQSITNFVTKFWYWEKLKP